MFKCDPDQKPLTNVKLIGLVYENVIMTYLFKSYEDFIGFYYKSVNLCISSVPEFSKSAS